ncbi:hypothetical protein [Arthrobacter sp. NPDC057013]|uniref:hypothetical protein n=1 Tax=Arthrobacter sp. NPDC057013 TaxID=3345999 RepID=UPI00363DC6B0
MNEPELEPTPRGRIEKILDPNFLAILPPVVVVAAGMNSWMKDFGFWLGLTVTIAASLALTIILTMPLLAAKKRRIALDAERGIFECAHREKGSVLKGRGAQGYAKAEPGRLLFQAKTGVTGPLAGSVEVYSAPTPFGEPIKAPWAVLPKGRIVALNTDKGVVELAASPASLALLRERCLGELA